MTFLLLAALPYVCWNEAASFPLAVAQAQRELGVETKLYIKVEPRRVSPAGADPKLGPALAWVNRITGFDFTIHIRKDVSHAMTCDGLRLIALHEVCHIKLTHYQPTSQDRAILQEKEADDCVRGQLSSFDYNRFNSDLSEASDLIRKENLEPPNFVASPRIPVDMMMVSK